eukprot:scaffold1126_cov242-Pinguiococcus_pyrenoidosus.AAC.1
MTSTPWTTPASSPTMTRATTVAMEMKAATEPSEVAAAGAASAPLFQRMPSAKLASNRAVSALLCSRRRHNTGCSSTNSVAADRRHSSS